MGIIDYYNLQEVFVVLKQGVYKGIKYQISFNWNYPCACIEINKRYRDFDPIVHGGKTFEGTAEKRSCDDFLELNKYYIGWDYGNDFDFVTNILCPTIGKKWSLEEIENDCFDCIDQYLNYVESKNKNA